MSVTRKFLVPLAAVVTITLATVAAINATVDVNGVYHDRQAFVERYVDALMHSEQGLVQVPYERLIKFELARRTSADCYLFGSSHIMTINLHRFPLLARRCSRLVNLGVSSASFEDVVIFMSALLPKEPGTQVYVEVPPWFFQEGENIRWTELSDAYENAAVMFGLGEGPRYTSPLRLSLNLISASYLLRNFDKLWRGGGVSSVEREIRSAWPPQSLGADDAVSSPEGALTYSYRHEDAPRRSGNSALFTTARPVLSSKVIRSAEIVFRTLVQQKLRVVLIMTPYHPDRWRCELASSACAFFETAASSAEAMAKRLGLELIGSYDPRQLGLSDHDFYDDQHVVIESLPKLSAALQR